VGTAALGRPVERSSTTDATLRHSDIFFILDSRFSTPKKACHPERTLLVKRRTWASRAMTPSLWAKSLAWAV